MTLRQMMHAAVALASASGAAAHNGRFHDLATIDRAVAEFAGPSVGSERAIQPVDRRLRLALCSADLALAWHGRGRATVRVACPVPGGWQVFVPVHRAPLVLDRAVVVRGDPVTIRLQGRGFAITGAGEALDQGAVGDWVRVRPAGTKPPLRAQVERAGLVIVTVP